MRILVAVSPTMYRETLAHFIGTNRPGDQVRLADPQDLDSEAASFRPHLIVCSDNAPDVGDEVSFPSSWVVIRYHDNLSASVFLDGRDPRLVQDMTIEDLLRVTDEARRLVVVSGGS